MNISSPQDFTIAFKKHIRWTLIIFVLIYAAFFVKNSVLDSLHLRGYDVSRSERSYTIAPFSVLVVENSGGGSGESNGCFFNVYYHKTFLIALNSDPCFVMNADYELWIRLVFFAFMGLPAIVLLLILSIVFYFCYHRSGNHFFLHAFFIPLEIALLIVLVFFFPLISISIRPLFGSPAG